jgi:diguanylate cyclase (GGDEF)-like protein
MRNVFEKIRNCECGLEYRIMLISIILGAVLCFIAGFINYLLGLGITSVMLLLLTGIMLLSCGYMSILRQKYSKHIHIVAIVFIFICLPIMYFLNGGVLGSVPYYMVLLAGITSIMFKHKEKYIIVIMYLLMFALLIIIEFNYPSLVIRYNSDYERIIDITSSIAITLLYNAILFNAVVKNFELEHERCQRLNMELHEEIILRKKAEEKIRHIAYHDTLTDLPNKRYLSIEMERAIELAKRSGKILGVLFIDFDDLKTINDSMGHFAGDHMLIDVSKRIVQILRKSDFVARIGGDEFIVMVEGMESIDGVKKVASKVLKTFEQPISINHQKWYVSASIGISTFPLDGNDLEQLIKNADDAMYIAKENGKNQYIFHSNLSKEKKKVERLKKSPHIFMQPQG